jgi:hypothetical protein
MFDIRHASVQTDSVMNHSPVNQPIELSYAKPKRKHWWHSKWIWRITALLGAIWLAWTCIGWGSGALDRYRCYRLEQEAGTWTNTAGATITCTPPATPVIHVQPTTLRFDKSLWAARSAEPWRVTGITGTPLFCHELTTPGGTSRVMQVYGTIVPGSPSRLKWAAVSIPNVDLHWVFHGTDFNQSMQSVPDIAFAEFSLRSNQPLLIDSGTPDASDRSTASFSYTLGTHRCVFRIHLFDDTEDGSVIPRMAFEMTDDPWHLPDGPSWYVGFSRSGFGEWPIAPAAHKK